MELEIKPFIKWAGGKRQLISEIERRLPKKFKRYYEPFVGGGALFMHLQNQDNVINDLSDELTNAYIQIKDNPHKLMIKLDEYEAEHSKRGKEFYYEIRDMDRNEEWHNIDNLIKAVRLIYLNKTCYNGLYRVNKKGYFNVPWNKKVNVRTYESGNIINLSKFLNNSNTKILRGDFESACENANKGDFIFFDPPYDMLGGGSFESYTKDGFGIKGQKRLAELFKRLDKKGCYVMLTNHNTPLINELYKEFNIDVVSVKRMINSDAKNRIGEETIIYNYDLEEVI
ncbi:MAG: DNA adenine methylase [Bacilli bacterium]|nr:DNA adenine methylase [Bacilli bacterium]